MAEDTWELSPAQLKDIRKLAVPAGAHKREVLVLVVGPDAAVATRASLPDKPDRRTLEKVLLGASVAADRLDRPHAAPSPPLSPADAALLDDAGLTDDDRGMDQFDRSLVEFDLLIRESLTMAEAARELNVGHSRLRQRLSPGVRTLYGVKEGAREWRLPSFQFAKRRLVRNIDKVLPSIRRDAHPLAVHRWFTEPHQDLVVDGKAVSPRVWLEAGEDFELVRELAAEI